MSVGDTDGNNGLNGAKCHATAKETARPVANNKAEGMKCGIVKYFKYVIEMRGRRDKLF
jgi:hypothetical protein